MNHLFLRRQKFNLSPRISGQVLERHIATQVVQHLRQEILRHYILYLSILLPKWQ